MWTLAPCSRKCIPGSEAQTHTDVIEPGELIMFYFIVTTHSPGNSLGWRGSLGISVFGPVCALVFYLLVFAHLHHKTLPGQQFLPCVYVCGPVALAVPYPEHGRTICPSIHHERPKRRTATRDLARIGVDRLHPGGLGEEEVNWFG